MTVALKDRALLDKLYYLNNDSTATTILSCKILKNLRKGPVATKGLLKMVLKFEHNSSLKSGLKFDRKRESVNVTGKENVSTALKEDQHWCENVQCAAHFQHLGT